MDQQFTLSETRVLDWSGDAKKYVYYLYDTNGKLLYVGQHTGIHPVSRIRDHGRDANWWGQVSRIEYVEVTGNLAEAERLEIYKLQPKHNQHHNPNVDTDPRETMPRYRLAKVALLERIVDGTYPLGSRFPPEPVLCEEFGYSRETIRRTVRTL